MIMIILLLHLFLEDDINHDDNKDDDVDDNVDDDDDDDDDGKRNGDDAILLLSNYFLQVTESGILFLLEKVVNGCFKKKFEKKDNVVRKSLKNKNKQESLDVNINNLLSSKT